MSHWWPWQEHFQWNEKMYDPVKWERMKDLKLVLSLQWLFFFFELSAFPDQSEGTVKKGKKSKDPGDTREVTITGKKSEMGRDKTGLQTFSFHEQCIHNEKPALKIQGTIWAHVWNHNYQAFKVRLFAVGFWKYILSAVFGKNLYFCQYIGRDV